jgi:CHAT domain-containing protein/Tfp pilus assembly protein PilF
VQPLAPNGAIRGSLAGGEVAVYSIDVPAESSAKIVVKQEGIDVGVTLRLAGSTLPEHGLDMVAGPEGDEVRYVAISEAPATWNIIVEAALPRAPRGHFTISLQIRPADGRARAVAALRQEYQNASDVSWRGDGKSLEEARTMFASIGERALAAGDNDLAAESIYMCARHHDSLGDVPGAIDLQLRATALFRQLGRRDRLARALNRLGDYSRKVGEVADAERYFQEALPLARETGDLIAVADILNNSGLLMLGLSRLEEALDQLQSAIPLARELGTANVEVALWNNSAEAYLGLGMPDRAVEAGERAVALVRGSNLPIRRTARALHLVAEKYFENGDRSRAEAAVREALALSEKASDSAYMAEALAFLGRMQHASGESDRAVESFARALPLLQQAQNRNAQAAVLLTWAEVDLDRGATDSALLKIESGLALARQTANRTAEAKALYLRARGLQKKGELDAAIASAAGAIEIVESTRGGITRLEMRTSYLARMRSYYDLYIELLQQRGLTADAFAAGERARARTLLESLAESGGKIRKGVDPALLNQERSLQARLNAKTLYRAQVVLKEGERSARAVALANDSATLLEEWKEVQAKIRVASPAYAALRMPEPVGVETVQKKLLDGESALISFHLGGGKSFAWVVDRTSITVSELPGRGRIDELARAYHQLLSREIDPLTAAERDAIASRIELAGKRLADAVWKPVAGRLRGKRLLIVADGALQYVPFGALPSESGRPLIAEHEIVYLPSASVLEVLRRESRPLTARIAAAVFADPVFAANDPRVAGAKAAAQPPQPTTRGGPYTRLRFSRSEATAIRDAAGDGTFAALDFTAAKKTLHEHDLRKYRVVHFATHGYLNTEQPELSGLVLSLVDAGGKPVDGFLNLHEIYNLELDADLVVLSACRTALGKEVHGEGLIGLTRGFMYAGASRVVSSIWNVDDRAGARLMSRFYTAMLADGKAPGAALREAQLALLGQPRWKHPHYWAAFSLQGEWR